METNKELGACINGVEVCNNKHLQLLGPWLFMMHYMQKIKKKLLLAAGLAGHWYGGTRYILVDEIRGPI